MSDVCGNNLSSDNESNTLLNVYGICQNNSLKYEGGNYHLYIQRRIYIGLRNLVVLKRYRPQIRQTWYYGIMFIKILII